jgi:hypothetical protein
MTSVIGVVFVGTAAWLARQAWRIDSPPLIQSWNDEMQRVEMVARWPSLEGGPDVSWGHKAPEICAMLGLIGTVIGLSLQAKALMSGPASFGALATSLFTTATGASAAILLIVMTHLVESGIRTARL